jgi:hypothetical protein
MTTSRAHLCIPAVLLAFVVGACGDDDEASSPTSSTVITTPSTMPLTVDTGDIPLPPPVDTGDIPLPPPVDTGDIPLPPPVDTSDIPVPPYVIEVTVGADSGPERVEVVPVGATVSISITNPTSDDEFHIHGYELGDGVSVPAGQAQTFTFVADVVGQFDVESHETGDILMVLSVV